MAEIMLETLVQRGVPVVRDVVIRRECTRFKQDRTPASVSGQFPSYSFLPANYQAGMRQFLAGISGMDTAADRAGRPGSCLGVSARRSPASLARSRAFLGWAVAKCWSRSSPRYPGLATAKHWGSEGPGKRCLPLYPMADGGRLCMPIMERPAERMWEHRTPLQPAFETRTAST